MVNLKKIILGKGTLVRQTISENEEYYGSTTGATGYGTRTYNLANLLENYSEIADQLTVDNFSIAIKKSWPIGATALAEVNPLGDNIEITSLENGILTIELPQVLRLYSGNTYFSVAIVFDVDVFYIQ